MSNVLEGSLPRDAQIRTENNLAATEKELRAVRTIVEAAQVCFAYDNDMNPDDVRSMYQHRGRTLLLTTTPFHAKWITSIDQHTTWVRGIYVDGSPELVAALHLLADKAE